MKKTLIAGMIVLILLCALTATAFADDAQYTEKAIPVVKDGEDAGGTPVFHRSYPLFASDRFVSHALNWSSERTSMCGSPVATARCSAVPYPQLA